MLSKIFSGGVLGIDGFLVDVEVDISPGLAQWNTVGLPESSVRESRDRVIAAIKNSGYSFERKRITINLAPADIRKEGTAFDLPIALGLLASSELISTKDFQNYLFFGELSLEGHIRPVPGILPLILLARKKKIPKIILPQANLSEATAIQGVEIFPVSHLSQVVQHFTEEKILYPIKATHTSFQSEPPKYAIDYSDIKGQFQAKRAFEIAAAGGHNILLMGPPGSGKTMLAQRLATILPPLTFEESLEASKIYSVSGLLPSKEPLLKKRPFRSPHHTISTAGLAGGGSHPRPGELSLAHHGVLFLDELPEFHKNVIEILRQPLESGSVTIARASGTITFPSKFMLVASMNPCRCGFRGTSEGECRCTPHDLVLYRSRISGPLLDRIDLQLDVPRLKVNELFIQKDGESSDSIRNRVIKARNLQYKRFGPKGPLCNAAMSSKFLKHHCILDRDGTQILEKAVDKLKLSARAFDRILKVAKTISDLEGIDLIRPHHLSEALQYRRLDRNL